MKKTFLKVLALTMILPVVIVVSCSKPDNGGKDDPKPTPTPTPTQEQIVIPSTVNVKPVVSPEGGDTKITFTAAAAWTASVINTKADSWVDVSPKQGNAGAAEITIKTTANDTYVERNATIQIKCGGETKDIVLTQKQLDNITVTTDKVELDAKGGTFTVVLKSNIEYKYEISGDWIKYVSTKAYKENTLTFTADANEDVEKREGSITIKGGEFSETVKVYQSGGEPTIVISKNEYTVDAAGGSVAIEVTSNVSVDMTIPTEADWITENKTKSVSTSTFHLDIAANEGEDSRSAEIVFSNKEKGLSETVRIVQNQKNALIVTSAKEVTIGPDGGTFVVSLKSNAKYEISITDGWVKEVQTKGMTDYSHTFEAEAIPEGTTSRQTSIVFTDTEKSLTESITIIQKYPIIDFADEEVKSICVKNWDTNGNGELDEDEAANVTSIGDVFKENYKIRSFNEFAYFTSVTSIGESAFLYCASLTSITLPNSVTSIGKSAFSYCNNLDNITLPNSVTSIGERAFSYCSNFDNITLPNSVTSIGELAFYNCSHLYNITLPNSVTSIGEWAFLYCASLTSITLPNSVTSIGKEAFSGCSSLASITLSESITSIEDGTFCNCYRLVSINIPESVTSIGSSAFYSCSSLVSINIPESVTSIGSSAFSGCSSLVSINIPESVTSIGYSAFCGCSSLVSINIPESVTSIGGCAFYSCSSLANINIPESVTSIGYSAFCGCSSLVSINIPESVTFIGEWAFIHCASLTSITLPESITSIEERTFYECSNLVSINIPEGVTSIGNEAFYACSNLASVYVMPLTPPSIESGVFKYSSPAKIYVPRASVDAYKAAWTDYADKIEPYDF